MARESAVVIRLETQGGERVKQQLRDIGTDGERALRRIEQSTTTAGRAQQAFGRVLDDVRSSVSGQAASLGPVGSALSALGLVGSAAGAGLAAVGLALVAGANEAAQAQQSYAKLEAVLKSTGFAAGLTADQISTLAEKVEKSTLATAEGVQDAAGILATFTSITGDTFKRAIELTVDLSSRFGGDLSSAATQLGKALEDPIEGISALRRNGVSFSASQKDVIQALYETGQVAEAQRVILDALEKQVGGTGAAEASGLIGAAKHLKDAWGDLLEEIDKTTGFSSTAASALRGLEQVTKEVTASLAGADSSAAIVALNRQLIEAEDLVGTLRRANAEGAQNDDVIAAQEKRVAELRVRLDALIEEARKEADKAADAERQAQDESKKQAIQRATEQAQAEGKRLSGVLGGLADDPAAKIAQVNKELDETRRKLEGLRKAGADDAAVDAAIAEAEAIATKKIEAINKAAAAASKRGGTGAADREAARNEGVLEDLQRDLMKLADSRQAFIDQAVSRLSAGATKAQVEQTRELVAELYDQKQQQEAANKATEAAARLQQEGFQVTASYATAVERSAAELTRLKGLLDEGAISVGTFNRAIDEANREALDGSRALSDGIERGLRDYAEQAGDAAAAAEEVLTGAFRAIEDTLAESIVNMSLSFESLAEVARQVAEDIAAAFIRQGLAKLAGLLVGTPDAGGITTTRTGSTPLSFHTGGTVTGERSFAGDAGPLFWNAPRLHSGGYIAPDEVPAILQKGETVLARGQSPVTVNVIDQRSSGAPVQVRETNAADGKRLIEVLVRDQVNAMIARGDMDRQMRARYGNRPVPR